ncbi:DNA polymerase III subunit epsilon [Denitromonas ohlonensis]|uniref:DNA polymerase III subunit epsilon n=2 Tax=Denitromonas TaxID=139331 RepID=A0A557RW84_9RHOO|nr:DNA polymerase III subunit epsilon [Denitromonas ohlonensis]TVT48546.1 MAG: DNA polymerase III subunit epsilon [Denitromonas halophila]TVO69378.1 DNA polymerase III subunit epsilon [Denitromonas ohlonensis]TVO77478.1 DNA polymerase III subunit epsilon [Denitromonas ohlonensis]TVT73125.1 MAG: DNA polymerase III subunit epsilon [Denitromonas halophila]TVT74180.1 MAG: DNA polymerase III subunit epsilon [Denitromonas halophila]
MRQIVLDTETTGLEWRSGDRVIEIGCVELVNRKLTGRHYHVYINPERDSDPGAIEVHGITNEFLADKPKFRDVAAEFEDFVRGGELIIHNANFDVGFLDNELTLINRPRLGGICAGVIDTLKMAKELNPGKRATLDALCERFDVDNARRTLHGALLDAELLAEVYLAMTRGQESLIIGLDEAPTAAMTEEHAASLADRPPLTVLRASEDELAEHAAVLADIAKATKGGCLWLPSEAPAAAD